LGNEDDSDEKDSSMDATGPTRHSIQPASIERTNQIAAIQDMPASKSLESTQSGLSIKRCQKLQNSKPLKQHFILDKAETSSIDGDEEQEEEEVAAIEVQEAEQAVNFINDSSQLGYSPGDQSNGEGNDENLHRAFDTKRNASRLLDTPVLTWRMRPPLQPSVQPDPWSNANRHPPDSTSGLGNMPFIHCILEDIEEFN
jgi:hypothetical protein